MFKTETESRAYAAGNYCNAYETQDWETAWAKHCDKHSKAAHAFLLGFFSSYELSEIADEEVRDQVASARNLFGVDND